MSQQDGMALVWARGIRPPPIYDPASWAGSERELSSAETSKPGKWDNSYTPFGVEPMQRMSLSDPTPRVVLMFCSQLIKTELLNNMIGYVVKCHPRRVMMVMPTTDMAEKHSKMRIAPMLEGSAFRGLIAPARSRDSGNTLTLKEFPGGALMVTGANSPAMARSWPMGVLLCDEISVWPDSLGGEGSPLHLFRIRLSSYGEQAKEVDTSTPGTKDRCAIEREYQESSQARYYVPCPECGEYQPLEWPQLKWEGQPDTPEFSHWYECAHCQARIKEHLKTGMFAAGRWEHAHPERPVKGYHLNALYMPVGRTNWTQLIREWISATARAKVGDMTLLQVFVNTRLAETWEDRGEVVDPTTLEHRGEKWGAVPSAVRAITIGVDVQNERLECEVVGWCAGLESYSLAYHVIPTDPLDRSTWEALDSIIRREWAFEDGRTGRAAAVCIDSGFRTQAVYQFANTRARLRVFATKGLAGPGRPIWDKKIRKGGKNKNEGRFHVVGVDTAKDSVAAYLRIREPGPGYCHFPDDRDREYYAQLTAEKRVRVIDRAGREHWSWEKITSGARNEALDCRVYALAAMHSLLVAGTRLDSAAPAEGPRPVRPARPASPAVEESMPAHSVRGVRPARPLSARNPKSPKSSWLNPRMR